MIEHHYEIKHKQRTAPLAGSLENELFPAQWVELNSAQYE
jgi:hypothetical protein